MQIYNLVSFAGIFILLGFAWLCSSDRRNLNWRVILWGLALQMAFALFIFAFQGLPTIVFFSALMALLYFFGIMPLVIRGFTYAFTRLMRVSGAESLCVASEIFLGIESSFAVRPYIERMTKSELTTILTAGMATVASNALAIYVFMLRSNFPAIEAIFNGANAGLKLIVGICALLLAFLGLVALADLILKGMSGGINHLFGIRLDWSLRGLLGYVFYPFTLMIGVPIQDAATLACLMTAAVAGTFYSQKILLIQ